MANTKKTANAPQGVSKTPQTRTPNIKNANQRVKAKEKAVAAASRPHVAAVNDKNRLPLVSPTALARGVAAARALAVSEVNIVPDGVQEHIDAALAAQKEKMAELVRNYEKVAAELAQTRMTAEQARSVDATQSVVIGEIERPKGEAGDRKKGFNLQEAMGLVGEDGKALYKRIQTTVHQHAFRAGIDLDKRYSKQEPEKLANVFKAVRKHYPYMTPKRFPQDWATAELLKQYIRNHRCYVAKKDRLAAEDYDEEMSLPNVEDGDDGEDAN